MKASFENNDINIQAGTYDGLKGFPLMFHSHAEIIYVISGSMRVSIDNIQKTLTPGQMSICFPYSVHEYSESPNAKTMILLFSPDAVGTFKKDLLKKRPRIPYLDDASHLFGEFLKVEKFSRENGKYEKNARAYLSAVVGEILTELDLYDIESTNEGTIQDVLIYCSEHFRDDDICLKKVADALFISKSYVSKIFSKKLSTSFSDYINTLRVNEAKKALRDTDLKVIDIMENCGFKNQSSFNRVFLESCRMTPREYRNKQRL